jgi:hypothetical protein
MIIPHNDNYGEQKFSYYDHGKYFHRRIVKKNQSGEQVVGKENERQNRKIKRQIQGRLWNNLGGLSNH